MDVKQKGFHWFIIITLLLGIYLVLGSPLYQPELGVYSTAGRNFSNFSNVSGTITLNVTNLTFGLVNGSQNNHITTVTFYWGRVVNSTGQFVRNFTFSNTTVNQSVGFNTTFNTTLMEDDLYNNVTVNVTNSSGFSNTTVVYNITIDNYGPTVNITNPAHKSNFSVNITTNQTFNATISDQGVDIANVTFNFTNQSGSVLYNSSNNNSGVWGVTVNISDLGQGAHTAIVYAYSWLGRGNISQNITFYVDGIAPVVIIDRVNNTNGTTNTTDTTPDVRFNVSDNVFTNVSCTLYVNGNANQTNTSVLNATINDQALFTNFTFNTSTSGTYTYYVNCTDGSANTGQSTVNTLLVDVTAPAVSITAPLDGRNFTNSSNIQNFNATVIDTHFAVDGVANVTFNITNGTATDGFTSINFNTTNASGLWGIVINVSRFAQEFHTASVYAYDKLGNLNSTVNITFAVDGVAPMVAFNITSTKQYTNTSDTTPDVQFNVTDNVFKNVSCRLYVNGQLNVTNLSVQNHTDTNMTFTPALVAGNYSFLVNCTDGSGNTGTSANLTWTIDNMAPIVSNITPRNSSNFTVYDSGHQLQNFNASIIDANTEVTNVTFRIRNGSWGDRNYTANNQTGIWGVVINLSGYFDDNYTVMVVTNDTVGNENDTQNFTIRVDRVAPSVSVGSSSVAETSAIVSAATNESVNNCTYSGPAEGSLNVDGNALAWSLSIGSLTANTDYTVTVNCTDFAGNSVRASTAFTTSKAASSSSSSGGGSSSSSSTSTSDSTSSSTSSESAPSSDGGAAAGGEGAGGPSSASAKAAQAAGAGKGGKSTKGRGAFAGRAIFDQIGTALQDLSTLWIVIVVLGIIVGVGIYWYNKRTHPRR